MLKNNRGITIIHALLGIIIFTVISSIILSSAMANARSMTRQRQYEQAYLTVSSAAKLFADSISGDTMVKTVESEKSIVVDEETEETRTVTVNKEPTWEYVESEDGESNPLKTFIMDKGKDGVIEETEFKMTTKNNAGDSVDIGDVIVKMYMKEGYTIFASFYLDQGDNENKNINYYMSVEIPIKRGYSKPISSTSTTNKLTKTTTTTKVYNYTFDPDSIKFSRGVYVEND